LPEALLSPIEVVLHAPSAKTGRAYVVAKIIDILGLEKVMFKAVDPRFMLGTSRTTGLK
jgi:hypothetical protein